MGELLGRQHAEHVRLILHLVARAVQLTPVRPVDEGRVVPRADGIEAQFDRTLQQGGELDLLVAAHAGVRRAAGPVLGHEVVDDVVAEPLGEVPHVERDAEAVRRPAGVHRVLDRAAAAAAGAQGSAGA